MATRNKHATNRHNKVLSDMAHHIHSQVLDDVEYNHLLLDSPFSARHVQFFPMNDEVMANILWDMKNLPARCIDIGRCREEHAAKINAERPQARGPSSPSSPSIMQSPFISLMPFDRDDD